MEQLLQKKKTTDNIPQSATGDTAIEYQERRSRLITFLKGPQFKKKRIEGEIFHKGMESAVKAYGQRDVQQLCVYAASMLSEQLSTSSMYEWQSWP